MYKIRSGRVIVFLLISLMLGQRPGLANGPDKMLWFSDGRPTLQAIEAIEILNAADSDGLEPQDYGSMFLRQAFAQTTQSPPIPSSDIAGLDIALTDSMQRYLRDLHQGRIDPRTVQQEYQAQVPYYFDVASYLSNAIAANNLAQAVSAAAPPLPLYESLRQALRQYRDLRGHPAWERSLPPPIAGTSVKPGQPYEGLYLLVWRLIALGDLPAGTLVPPRYEGLVVDGIRAFQSRHGLDADGVLGDATLRQLQITPEQRVRQIILALERLRWTPLSGGQRMVAINIPEFVLRAYEVERNGVNVRSEMKVIVGRAQDTRTPLFQGSISSIEFSPYWNIPLSIARTETIPKLRVDPAYLRRQGFEFVTSKGQISTAVTASNLDAAARGALRIRQRPGPENALGGIKFIFPNDKNIYLHHTPASQLFQRPRRDFSHGCIRLEDPLALAKFVLQDQPEWTDDRIKAYMDRGVSQLVRVEPPVTVVIAYGTVAVKNGKVYFFADLYGQDLLLDKALQSRQRFLQ